MQPYSVQTFITEWTHAVLMSFLAPENMAIAVCAFIILTLIFAVIVGLVTDSLWGIREQTGLLRQIERNTRPKDGREPTE